jgi:hypothetical protein
LYVLRGGQIDRQRGIELGSGGRKNTRPSAFNGILHDNLARWHFF